MYRQQHGLISLVTIDDDSSKQQKQKADACLAFGGCWALPARHITSSCSPWPMDTSRAHAVDMAQMSRFKSCSPVPKPAAQSNARLRRVSCLASYPGSNGSMPGWYAPCVKGASSSIPGFNGLPAVGQGMSVNGPDRGMALLQPGRRSSMYGFSGVTRRSSVGAALDACAAEETPADSHALVR
jgi:hypothetical protein